MIKVLLVIPTLDQSGAEKQFQLLATGLPRDIFDVRVVALTRGGPYAEAIRQAGIPVTVLGKRLKFDPALASGPILTTITDMCGFFFVLSFATLMLSRLH